MGLRFLTAGESHGKALMGILEGMPAGLALASADIDVDLRRRQGGYGRGGRMKIETDHAEIISGVRWGLTLGSPIGIVIENRDWQNWSDGMSADAEYAGSIKPVERPRPGHADLAGVLKYDQKDVRNILERSSARETAMRVALGAIAKKLLAEFGIRVGSYVVRVGRAAWAVDPGCRASEQELLTLFREAEKSPVRCPDPAASRKMMKLIDQAKNEGNSLGGAFEVFLTGMPAGVGSHVHWDRRLEAKIAEAVMSIQAVKGVEVGDGFSAAEKPGSEVMDEIYYRRAGTRSGFYRKTNHAGGIEGGMSNGMPVVIRAAMKPIPTLRKPLMSVDIATKKAFEASYERSDVCAVPAAAVVAEAMAALAAADAFLAKFGGDSRGEVLRNYEAYRTCLRAF